ncbi:MAG TPA: Ig-like domain repeat protein [Gemmatimonadales bacterium]|nr:Ig-like domain repeat protein [Gemmatimonadales bacterium]
MFAVGVSRRFVPALALLGACGGADLLLPGEGQPAAIQVVHGDGQSGRVGAALAAPVVALVTDGQGRPVDGVAVVFELPEGSDASVTPDTVLTGSDGQAAFHVTMGTRVGSLSAQVAVSASGAGTLTAPVTLAAVSADANGLAAVSGDSQTAPVSAALPDPLVVEVTDGFGNPIPGVAIAWTVDGGGSVSDATTTTGADGLTSVHRTLGPNAGTQRTLASAPGLAGSPVEFTATATAGAATVLELVSGDGQSALVGTALPAPLVVRAHDADGNGVPGLAVAWIIGQGGGGLAPTTSLTGADGRASTQWTLGGSPGTNTATAVISGVGTVAFSATGNPGTPPGLSLATDPPSTAERGVALSRAPVVQLLEPGGSPRRQAGVSVTVALLPGGANLRGTLTRGTGPDGQATFAGLAIEGPPGTYSLAFSATGYSGVTSAPITLARASTTITIQSDDPDPSAPGQTVRVQFTVQSPGGSPDGTVTVTSDDGASCSASVSAGECSLSLSNAGSRTLTAAYGGSAEFAGSTTTASHTVAAPQPVSTTTRITSDDPDPSDVGQAVTVRFNVTAESGTPTGTVTVSTSASGDACSASVGDGACTITLTQTGDQTLTATFAPSGNFAGSTGTAQHTVRTPGPPPPPPPAVPSATASSIEVKDATIGLNHHTDVTVTVRDAGGQPLEHVSVTLTATGDGNSIDPASATTDKNGKVKFHFQSSVAGSKTLTAVAGGVTLSQQPTITVTQGTTRTSINSDAPDPSAPGEAVVVEYAVASDEGSPTGAVMVTASSGESCNGNAPTGSCSLTLTSPGSITITASYAGDANFAPSSGQVPHTVSAPLPPVLAIRSQPSGNAAPSQPFDHQPELQLRAADGSELHQAGVAIAAELGAGTGTLMGITSVTTDADGRAAFTDLAIAGPAGNYTLRFTASGFTPIESATITLALLGTRTQIVADAPDPSTVGEAVTIQFAVQAESGGAGTPTGSVTVTSDDGESCSAAVSDGACTISFGTAGSFNLTASYGGDGTFDPSKSNPEPHAVTEPPPPPVGFAGPPRSNLDGA